VLECLKLRQDSVEPPHVRQTFELAAARAEVAVKVSGFYRMVGSKLFVHGRCNLT